MRILHTIPGLNWGGMEFRVIEQVAWLNAHGHPAWLATPKQGESYNRALAQGLPVVDFNFDRPWRWPTIRKLRSLLRELAIDVADVHVTRDAKAMMACLDLVAVVRSRHITQRLRPGLVRALQWKLGADGVITVADCICQAMTAGGLVDPKRVDVVGEWADKSFFIAMGDECRCRLRREIDLQDDQTAICCVGMLRPEKGQDVLIDALAHLPKRFVVVMIGSATGEGDAHANTLAERAERLGVASRIRWLGYRTDIPEWLAASDIVAVPSLLEAQSRIVPQAFAAGKPVVATLVGGLPELVHDGKTGLLVPPNDSHALAQAVLRLSGDSALAASLTENARIYAETHLRLDAQMNATLAIYAKALERACVRAYFRKRNWQERSSWRSTNRVS